MKRLSTFDIREMKSKARRRYCCVPTRMDETKRLIMQSVCHVVQQQELSDAASGSAKWPGHYGKQFGSF